MPCDLCPYLLHIVIYIIRSPVVIFCQISFVIAVEFRNRCLMFGVLRQLIIVEYFIFILHQILQMILFFLNSNDLFDAIEILICAPDAIAVHLKSVVATFVFRSLLIVFNGGYFCSLVHVPLDTAYSFNGGLGQLVDPLTDLVRLRQIRVLVGQRLLVESIGSCLQLEHLVLVVDLVS